MNVRNVQVYAAFVRLIRDAPDALTEQLDDFVIAVHISGCRLIRNVRLRCEKTGISRRLIVVKVFVLLRTSVLGAEQSI